MELSGQTLEYGAVLAVNGQNLDAFFLGGFHHDFTSDHQGLFVGQGDVFAGGNGIHGGAQSSKPHQGGEHNVDAVHFYQLGNGVGA